MDNRAAGFQSIFGGGQLDFTNGIDGFDIFNKVAGDINKIEENEFLKIVEEAGSTVEEFRNASTERKNEFLQMAADRGLDIKPVEAPDLDIDFGGFTPPSSGGASSGISFDPSPSGNVSSGSGNTHLAFNRTFEDEPEQNTVKVAPAKNVTPEALPSGRSSEGTGILPSLSGDNAIPEGTIRDQDGGDTPSNQPSGNRSSRSVTFEARRNKQGQLVAYNSPPRDANSREIAGFGNVTNNKKYKQLDALLKKGDHEGAERLAGKFLSERGQPFTKGITSDSKADIINGVVHNRGPAGFRSIAKFLGVTGSDENLGKTINSLTSRSDFANKWVVARAKQERENEIDQWKSQTRKKEFSGTLQKFRRDRAKQLGGAQKVFNMGTFPKGLYNRWVKEAKTLTRA